MTIIVLLVLYNFASTQYALVSSIPKKTLIVFVALTIVKKLNFQIVDETLAVHRLKLKHCSSRLSGYSFVKHHLPGSLEKKCRSLGTSSTTSKKFWISNSFFFLTGSVKSSNLEEIGTRVRHLVCENSKSNVLQHRTLLFQLKQSKKLTCNICLMLSHFEMKPGFSNRGHCYFKPCIQESKLELFFCSFIRSEISILKHVVLLHFKGIENRVLPF